MSSSTKFVSTFLGAWAFAAGVSAAPVTYNIDSAHTYPELRSRPQRRHRRSGAERSTADGQDHARQGSRRGHRRSHDGHEDDRLRSSGLNNHAQTPDIFDTAKFPTATYKGRLAGFRNGAPTTVEGSLTMHGVTKPVTLTINSFKCAPDRSGGEVCGADAGASSIATTSASASARTSVSTWR